MRRTLAPLLALLSLPLLLGGCELLPTSAMGSGERWTPDPRHDRVADSLVHTLIQAAGGMERYRELRTARYTLTTEWWDVEIPRIRRTRPRYITLGRDERGELSRLERWEGEEYIVQGWDGVQGWATLNGEFLEEGIRNRDEVEYVASDVQYWISLPYKLRDEGLTLHYDGRDEGGRHLVRVTFDEGVGDHQDIWHYLFAEGEPWPVEVRYQEPAAATPSRTRWEEIRTVDGYTFVGRRVHLDAQDRITRVLYTHHFEFNPEIDFRRFSEP